MAFEILIRSRKHRELAGEVHRATKNKHNIDMKMESCGWHLKSLQVNRQNCDEECVCQKPVCHKDHHSKSTELSDSATGKAGNYTKDRVIGATL